MSADGTVLGLFDDRQYELQIIDVAPGSLFIAYSDGLSEAENPDGEEFGDQRVLDVALRRRLRRAQCSRIYSPQSINGPVLPSSATTSP